MPCLSGAVGRLATISIAGVLPMNTYVFDSKGAMDGK
jgi:hypothetical protein